MQSVVLLTEVNNIVVVNPILTGFDHRQVTVTLARAPNPRGGQEAHEIRQGGPAREGSQQNGDESF